MSFHLTLLSLYHKNKTFEHSVLGKVSCEAYLSTFNECAKRSISNRSYCDDLFGLVSKCYRGQTVQEVSQYIDEQLDERRRLLNFLKERDSLIPERLHQHNTWNIFHAAVEQPVKAQTTASAANLSNDLKFIKHNDS